MRVLLAVIAVAACGHPAPRVRGPESPSGDELTLYRDVTVVRQRVDTALAYRMRVPANVTAKDVLVIGGHARVRDAGAGEVVVEGGPALVSYTTTAIAWQAAYTMTTTSARDHATLTGALTIRNGTGIELRGAARVVDAPVTTHPEASRELGTLELAPGDTRIPLVEGAPRRMHAVLVYDPIGTKLDNPSPIPLRDATLGIDEPASPNVSESFEIERDAQATRGLPAGPVRLVIRDSGHLIGEGRLFEATRADVDTIAIGTAEGITGTRERRELTDEEARHRLVEEFVITLDNKRAHAADVMVREHLYRGQTWAVAYQSVPDVHQDGAQAFTMRTRVPARGQVKIMYVVVYTWGT